MHSCGVSVVSKYPIKFINRERTERTHTRDERWISSNMSICLTLNSMTRRLEGSEFFANLWREMMRFCIRVEKRKWARHTRRIEMLAFEEILFVKTNRFISILIHIFTQLNFFSFSTWITWEMWILWKRRRVSIDLSSVSSSGIIVIQALSDWWNIEGKSSPAWGGL